jgi:hypothetical protein
MLRSFDWDFRSSHEILDIQSRWQAMGQYEWRAFDNDVYGVYIVARDPKIDLRIKITGDRPDYSLEMHFDVEAERMAETADLLFKTVFTKLLPAADATDVRPYGTPISDP